ncbi:MAG: hypothetical protein ACE5KT_00925 [Methanosarcinales archaeon]
MLEKQDKTIEILKSVKDDTSAIKEKQDKMLEKQDKTIEILESVKDDTSAIKTHTSVLKFFYPERIEKIEREIKEIKAKLSELMPEVK